MSRMSRVAAAPITWGVCELPGWGHQLSVGRVLREVASLGFTAIEAGPEGFLPTVPDELARVLRAHGLRLVGGFVPAVLHDPEVRPVQLAAAELRARWLSSVGAEVMVLAASTGLDQYAVAADLPEHAWDELFQTLALVEDIAARHGLALAVHPHFGTIIERRHHVQRFLAGCEAGLCLDTGHLTLGGADPVEIAERAAARVRLVHLKDADQHLAGLVAEGEVGYHDAVRRGLYRPLGEGDVGIARVIEVLEGSGYSGRYVLEQDMVLDAEPEQGSGPAADALKSLEYLRQQLSDG